MSKLTLDREVITPKQASAYLEANVHNRNLRQKQVERLVGAIQRGEWVETGDPIKFNGDSLVDGQHRLAAIAAAGKRVPVWVARGVPADAQEVVDTGSARTVGDMLKLRGYKNANEVAAIARGLWNHRKTGEVLSAHAYIPPTPQEVLQVVVEEPTLVERASFGVWFRKQDRSLGIGPSLAGTLSHLFGGVSTEEDAAKFFDELLAPPSSSCAPAVLRRRLLQQSMHRPMAPRMVAALTIKAWNAWLQGERPTRLTWRAGGAKKESFPSIAELP